MADPLGPSILAAIFLIFAAFVYALSAALPNADQAELRKQSEQGSSQAQRILRLLARFDDGYGEIHLTYAALLIAGFAAFYSFTAEWLNEIISLPSPACALIAATVYSIAAFTLTAIIPGGIAGHTPRAMLRFASAPAELAISVLSVITLPAYWLGKGILHLFHIQPGAAAEHVSEEEILAMMDIGEETGAIESDEKEMIENIFEFGNMTAEDCMVHRKDIIAIDADSTDDEVMELILESGRSRIPVYEDTIDNITGILICRDFLVNRCQRSPVPLRKLIRPAYFVPESVRTDALFREMQTRKQHMAIVIDEYGGISGLVTLEDLLEEIVGNIYDEFDPKEEQDVTALPDGRWRAAGSAELETLAEAIGVDLPLEEEYGTLGGMVFSQLTEIPADGECPVVECFGLRISVTEIADRRVEWAIIEKLPGIPPCDNNENNAR